MSSESPAIFRVGLGNEARLARGDVARGPQVLLDRSLTLDRLLAPGGGGLTEALTAPDAGPVPAEVLALPPVETQEVWAAGVTYGLSRNARVGESDVAADCYHRVYDAPRPELFFKAPGWRVRGSGSPIRIRADSGWDVPEPELGLVLDSGGTVVAYTIGNDVSSRSIEGENPLYLPQAKSFDGACALGPGLVPASALAGPFEIAMTIRRGEVTVFDGTTSTAQMRRGFDELVEYLLRELTFPVGAVLLTGTALVPEPPVTLAPGDEVTIAIPGLGELRNRVAQFGGADA